MGLLDLPQRAYAERAYYALARAVLPKLDLSIRAQRDAYDELREKRSEEHTSELQSLMRISYAVFCLKKKKQNKNKAYRPQHMSLDKRSCQREYEPHKSHKS